ncbi:MAG: hypothetical protein SFX73_40620 [Kofleriaceae bacterium]|nr:hypothetical protein [Kofleriaceae bacterium]
MRWLALFFVCFGCSGDDEDANTARRSRCEQVRNHLVELRLASATNVDVAAHRTALRRALGDEFIARCETSMSDAVVSCALAASDSAGAAACNASSATN